MKINILINTDAGPGAWKATDKIIENYSDPWSLFLNYLDLIPTSS